jgi:hypothetical protein
MSRATTLDATPDRRAASRGFGALLRRLAAAVVVVAAGGMLATAFDRDMVVADAQRPVPTPSAAPMVAPAGDPSLPDAGTVFRDREIVIEEPMPTF